MKACPHCGATYSSRVDFCFQDGTPLVRTAAPPAPTSAPPAGLASMEVPEPRNLRGAAIPAAADLPVAGLDAADLPEPRGISAPPQRLRAAPPQAVVDESLAAPEPLAAPTLVPSLEPELATAPVPALTSPAPVRPPPSAAALPDVDALPPTPLQPAAEELAPPTELGHLENTTILNPDALQEALAAAEAQQAEAADPESTLPPQPAFSVSAPAPAPAPAPAQRSAEDFSHIPFADDPEEATAPSSGARLGGGLLVMGGLAAAVGLLAIGGGVLWSLGMLGGNTPPPPPPSEPVVTVAPPVEPPPPAEPPAEEPPEDPDPLATAEEGTEGVEGDEVPPEPVPTTTATAVDPTAERPSEPTTTPAGTNTTPPVERTPPPTSGQNAASAGTGSGTASAGSVWDTPASGGTTPTASSGSTGAGSVWGEPGEQAAREGTLQITSDPVGAVVFLDNRRLGAAPSSAKVPFGTHSIRVEKDGYITQTQSINVQVAEDIAVPFQLKPTVSQGTVQIVGHTYSLIYVDGRKVGTSPTATTLPPGRHSFRVVKEDGSDFVLTREVIFQDASTPVIIDLNER